MQQNLPASRWIEIPRMVVEIDIRNRQGCVEGGSGKPDVLGRQQQEIGRRQDQYDHGGKSWRNPSDSAGVKPDQGEHPKPDVLKDQRADQVPGNDEEDIDPDESAGHPGNLQVVTEYRE